MKHVYNAALLVLMMPFLQTGCKSSGDQEKGFSPVAPEQSGILTPVKWSFSVNKISDTEAELLMKASIDKGWHLYSMEQDTGDGVNSGPTPLTIEFEKNANYSLDGAIIESAPIKAQDPVFEMEVKYFEQEAVYKQKIKLLTKDAFTVSGFLNFQSCDDEKCIMPTDEELKFEIPAGGV